MNIRKLRRLDLIVGSVLIVLLRPASIILGTILRRDHELVVRKQLAVLKIKGGGSLLLAMPAMLSLRRKYPDKTFVLVTSAEVKPFAELMGVFDEYVLINAGRLSSFALSTLNAMKKVWRADGLINFEIHSKLATVFSSISCARNRFGFYHETNSFQRDVITHLFFYNITSPVYVNYNQVALALGAEILPYQEVSDYFMQLNRLSEQRSEGEQRYRVVVAPYCSELGKEREFSAAHWVEILRRKFGGKRYELILLGGRNDMNRATALADCLEKELPEGAIINRVGETSLKESALIIQSADEFLTIDSGLNHIARLIGGSVNITSYWGPTDPVTRLAPFPALKETVIYQKLFCSPCVHVVSSPPCKGDNICMKQYVSDNINQYSTGGWIIISDSATPKII